MTAIYETYSNNTVELNKIIETINTIKNDTNVTITHISIHGYASPDGPYRLNEKLARERTQSVKEYVKTNFPQEVITKIERRRSGVEVELANDYSLKFNSKGKFVGMDD